MLKLEYVHKKKKNKKKLENLLEPIYCCAICVEHRVYSKI